MLQRACSRQQLKANIRPESLQQFCLITCVHILGYHGAEKLFCFTKRQKMGLSRPVKITDLLSFYLPTSVIGKNRLPCPFHPLSLSLPPTLTHVFFLSLVSFLSLYFNIPCLSLLSLSHSPYPSLSSTLHCLSFIPNALFICFILHS